MWLLVNRMPALQTCQAPKPRYLSPRLDRNRNAVSFSIHVFSILGLAHIRSITRGRHASQLLSNRERCLSCSDSSHHSVCMPFQLARQLTRFEECHHGTRSFVVRCECDEIDLPICGRRLINLIPNRPNRDLRNLLWFKRESRPLSSVSLRW
jgi:hypothetical protein